MKIVSRVLAGSLLLLGLCATAQADISLEYLGAFRVTKGVYNGDLTFRPTGDGGNGSLYYSSSTGNVYEVAIPSLLDTGDPSTLNSGTTLNHFTLNGSATGMCLRSTDNRLYYCNAASGGAQAAFHSCNPDGTDQSAANLAPPWSNVGSGLCEVPTAWANDYANGRNIISAGYQYGIRLHSLDPWNTPITRGDLLAYTNDNPMDGYNYGDPVGSVAWVRVGGEADFVVGGKPAATSEATLWFINAADLENPVAPYDPQPYKTLSVQNKLLVAQMLYGLAYDPGHQILYGVEGAYMQPTVIHAWKIVDEAPTAVTDLAGSPADWFSVALSWTAPTDDHGLQGAAVGYDIRYSTSSIDDTNWDSATQVSDEPAPLAAGQTQDFTVTGLEANTGYYFALKAVDAYGNVAPLSNIAFVTTNLLDTVAPAAVGDLAAGNIKPNRVTFSWSATGDDGMTDLATTYDLRYGESPIVDDASFAAATPVSGLPMPSTAGSPETVIVTGLSPSTTYYAAIKVGDEVPNFSVLSNVVSFTTSAEDTMAPVAVTDLHVVPDIHVAYLSWTVPADVGTAGLDGYDIRYSVNPITEANWDSATQVDSEPVPGAAGTTDRYVLTGLDASTTYYFAIRSYDCAEPTNVSDLSNVVTETTRPPIVPVTVHNPWLVNDRVADTHTLDTMGATYVNAYTPDGVVLPTNDEQKAINIYNNQKRRLYHWAVEPPGIGGDIGDASYNQNVFGWSLCGRHASQARQIAQAAGFTQRVINLPGHWVYELQYDGGWHLFDTMTTMYVYNLGTPRTIASCEDITSSDHVLADAVADGRACPGFLLCGDDIPWYQDAVNHYSAMGSSVPDGTWTGDMDLRIGQTFDRTWEAWQNQRPTSNNDADSMPGADPPYHHECQNDWKDYVNWPYWEPYGASLSYIINKATYRRWANGTDTLAPDFHSAAYQESARSGQPRHRGLSGRRDHARSAPCYCRCRRRGSVQDLRAVLYH